MKQIRFTPDFKQPYGLHDFRINGINNINGDIELVFENGFMKLNGPDFPNLQGNKEQV